MIANRVLTQPLGETFVELVGCRVLVIIDSFALGGAERQAILLARELRSLGAHAEVWALFPPIRGMASDLCDSWEVPRRALDLRWEGSLVSRARTLARLAWLVRCSRSDVLLPYTIGPNVLCGAVWRATGAATCIWNQRDDGLYSFSRGIQQWSVRQTPRFVANSSHVAEFLIRELCVPGRLVNTVPNGVELAPPLSSRHEWRTQLGLASDTFVAGIAANLRHTKDHQTALRAWKLALSRLPTEMRAVLLLAGRRDNAATLVQNTIAELELSEMVRVLGPVSDMSGFLEACDLSVFSSIREGLPNAVLESMLTGLPIAATGVPGVVDALVPGGLADMVPAGDAERLANLIVQMATNPEYRARAGARNRERASASFSMPAMVGGMAAIILSATRSKTYRLG